MPRSKSSSQWLKAHFNDPYVKRAQQEGYRSRAVYKLIEIQEKDKIFKSGMVVVDLGAAPGGWSQLLKQWVGEKGQVFALDILPMDPIPGVSFLQGDFKEDEILQKLLEQIQGQKVDVVISDMAPNLSGTSGIDSPRVMYLAELALDFAQKTLRKEGTFLIKLFHGEGFDDFLRELRKIFQQVIVRKPKASRSQSSEVYLLGKGFKKQ